MQLLAFKNRLRVAVLLAIAAYFTTVALAAKPGAANYLERAMPHLVATMTKDFAPYLGKRTKADQFFDMYDLRVLSLPHAVISHTFAAPSQREYWSVHFVWYFPPTTDIARASDLAEKYLAPSLKGFRGIGALDKRTGAVITTWTASNGRRVVATPFVEAASGSTPASVGVAVSVRHYVTAHHRYALYASGMTPTQRKALLGAFARQIAVGLREAPTNFAAIRGRKVPNSETISAEEYFSGKYASAFQLGLPYATCNVRASFFHPNNDLDDSNWALQCESPTIFGTSLPYSAVRKAIVADLPSTYVKATTHLRAATLFSNHRERWNSPDGTLAVVLEDADDYEASGGTYYTIFIAHFIPNQ